MNDHGSIERHYRMKGIIPDYTHTMSHKGCLLSLGLSGSTYQGIYNLYRYFRYQEMWSEPLNYQGVYLMNTSFFFTSKGLSLKFKQAYRYSEDLLFMASYETVYKGKSTHELGITARYTLPRFYDATISAGILASFGTSGWNGGQSHVRMEVPVLRHMNVNASYYLWNSNTLDGERHIPSQETSNIDHEFMLGVSLTF